MHCILPWELRYVLGGNRKFTESCDQIKSSLINQINSWQTADNCKDGGEKCLYKLISQHGSLLKATHETPKKHYIDDLMFTFKQVGDTCEVQGNSRSQLWYALLDMGTNYCNLHNLITGAGLDSIDGYQETTSSTKCTQYTTADCEVY
ncbi:hypothetical protein LSH36_153g00062 [Paralvinella palmiformis]|uniref:Uncharacterized protein n=1 Tax=Paralvinella palmiformis TaxID=53620 RepID=A0AAD9N8L1_9ANNE|nr:hypothetical protein LSH36_153g00062 [Paralvinella palmiformis]